MHDSRIGQFLGSRMEIDWSSCSRCLVDIPSKTRISRLGPVGRWSGWSEWEGRR